MLERVLAQAAAQLHTLCALPPLVLAASRLEPRGIVLLLEWPKSGVRRRLVFDLDPRHPTLHIVPASREASETGSIALGERLVGRRLLGVEPGPEPRVWRFRLSEIAGGVASDPVTLLAAWIGKAGNLHLIDTEETVLAALVPRGPGPGERYHLPVRGAAGGTSEAAAGVGPGLPAVADEEPDLLPPVDGAAGDGVMEWMELLRRRHEQAVNQALSDERRAVQLRLVRQETQRLLRLRRNLEVERGDPGQGLRLRRSGEAILSHMHAIAKGADRLVVEGWGAGGGALEVALDPSKPAAENARLYFHRARRWERGEPHRKRRMEEIDRAIARLSLLAARVAEAVPSAADGAFLRRLDEALGFLRRSRVDRVSAPPSDRSAADRASGGTNRPGRGWDRTDARPGGGRPGAGGAGGKTATRGAAQADPRDRRDKRDAGFRPRRFTTQEGWQVLVGRSNEENDWVTHRAAHPEDYWFHAHGCPGSHVVLQRAGRKDNPSARTLEEVAAIAAFFSKARHSSKAPVIYTLKKYVRKPRGAKPGLAVCEREKTLMVRPKDPGEGREPEWMEE